MSIKDELAMIKELNDTFKSSMAQDMGRVTDKVATLQASLGEFMNKEKTFHDRTDHFFEEKTTALDRLDTQIESLRTKTKSQVEELDFQLKERVKTADMR